MQKLPKIDSFRESGILVLNWPGHYYELYNKPRHPLFADDKTDSRMSLRNFDWITFNPESDAMANRTLHFHNFILQDVCMRSLMQYPDFVAGDSRRLSSLVSKFNKQVEEV